MDLKFLHRDLKFQQQSNTLRDVYCRGDLYYISPLVAAVGHSCWPLLSSAAIGCCCWLLLLAATVGNQFFILSIAYGTETLSVNAPPKFEKAHVCLLSVIHIFR